VIEPDYVHPMSGPQALSWFLSAMAFAIAMSATPGPNNAMVAASGATFGIRRTVPHILGVSCGFPLMLLAVAFGAGALLRAWPGLYTVMKWIGAAYLIWLAWHIATARPAAEGTPARRDRPLRFIEAALFQWVNPKAWLIALGAVATYTSAGSVVVQVVTLSVLFLAVCVPCLTLWTAMGAGAARLLRGERGLRAFNLTMAALLIASLVPLLTEG
jgi:threonine/homoserine/homoserine lactone efflux protein